MHRFKITTRLRLGFGLVIALMTVIVAAAIVFGGQTRQAVADLNRTSAVVSTLKDVLLDVRNGRSSTWYYVASGDPEAVRDRLKSFERAEAGYAILDKIVLSAAGRAMLSQSVKDFAVAKKSQEVLIDLKKSGVSPASSAFKAAIEDLATATTVYVASITKLTDFDKALSAKALGIAEERLDQAALWSLVIGIVGIVFGGSFAWIISGGIATPLGAMTKAMARIAGGDLSTEVPSLSSSDEIGSMAKAVQIFKDNGLRLKATEAEAARNRQLAEQERAANEAARGEVQRQQEAVVESIASGLDRLSKGDLTSRLNQVFTAEYEKLRADFNATADSLREAMTTIAAATDGISTGSDQIAHASDDLSRRTEQQAASLEETSAALNIITDTVRTMAGNAGDAAKVVLATRAAAEASGAVVQQAIDAMGRIKGSSTQISNIIGVIDEIAFQTNLLALNAGVEAARAGDAGRGFAVVASEVRGLAQRSAEAAKEIKALISASTVQVESGVVLVDKTGVALKDIVAKVLEMDVLVQRISSSSREQATGLAEINTAVSQMDQVVQQNAAMVEESTAAAHALKSETQDLTTMIGRFQIGGSPGRRGNPVHAVQARIAGGLKSERVVRLAPKSMGSAARKLAPVEKDWEEF